MTQKEIFGFVVDVLNKLKIPYMVVGSITSIIYGKPRLTNDMDIVIAMSKNEIKDFVSCFDDDWYVDSEMIEEAIRDKFHFNIIHIPSGNKIDFFLLRNENYDREQFLKRKEQKFDEERTAYIASVEDVIIKKLDYYLEGKSEKHLEDIRGILEISKEKIDFAYIDKWTRQKGSCEIWEKLKSK